MPTEKRGVNALKIWCRRVTSLYENVNILVMDQSWRDGIAFCALIDHFRPGLLGRSVQSLDPSDILDNNSLAFRVAEEELGIPSLLDPQDMVDTDVPDKFSVITYVSQFYHLLKDEDNSRSPSLKLKGIKDNSLTSSTDSSSDSSCANSPSTPTSVPRSVFTSSNPILSNNKFSPSTVNKRATNSAVAKVCQDLENKIQLSAHSR